MGSALRRASSRLFGWLSDRRLPRALRAPVYRTYARAYGVDLSELRLALEDHPSFGAFFVRRLREGARPLPADLRALPSPCDGRLQALDRVESGSILQAKGRPYEVAELLGAAGADLALEGGWAWTIYLSPRDYHRVHCPLVARLTALTWTRGELLSGCPPAFERGAELARFEMGSTVVLIAPRGGYSPLPALAQGAALRMGQPIGARAG